jgi:hypothetical protein
MESNNVPHLVQYARKLYTTFPEIQQSREIGYIPPTIDPTDHYTLIQYIRSRIIEMPSERGIRPDVVITNEETTYEISIISREVHTGFALPWHLDDCALIKHSVQNRGAIYTNAIATIADGKYTIYCKGGKRPKYSCVVYWSEGGRDFRGGVFEFADGVEVKAEERKYILFDSRDVHRVTEILSGERKNLLIKFY